MAHATYTVTVTFVTLAQDNNDLHLPSAQSKLFQKGVFYSGIKMYNHLALTVKELSCDVK
jgi:hypothetical protein